MQVSRECLLPEVRRVVNGVRESRFSQLRTDLRATDDRGNRQHYDVAITHPTRKDGGHKKVLSAANRRELQKLSKYGCNERSYKSDAIHLLPWRVKPVISLVTETRGGLSQNTRGLINLCATSAESNAAPGFNPKLKAKLTSKFMYNIVSTIWLNNASGIMPSARLT
jgi:hypothetical protein